MQKMTIDHIFNRSAQEPELAGRAASEVALAIAYGAQLGIVRKGPHWVVMGVSLA